MQDDVRFAAQFIISFAFLQLTFSAFFGFAVYKRHKICYNTVGDNMKKDKLFIIGTVLVIVFALVIVFLMTDDMLTDNDTSSQAESLIIFDESSEGSDDKAEESLEETETVTVTESSSQEKEYVSYTFRTQKQFDGHYEKHGKEFGDITQEEYLKKANDLINNDSDTILHKTEAEDGDYIFYDTVNNEILFLSTDGYIRTYFKPNRGIDYYNDQ